MGFRILPKEIETLWTLFTGPAIWAVHFLFCYVWAAIYCAKRDQLQFGMIFVRGGIGVATVIALVLVAAGGYLAWRQWGFGVNNPPHNKPTEDSRTLFQGFSTLLLSALSFVAVVFTALPTLFIQACWP